MYADKVDDEKKPGVGNKLLKSAGLLSNNKQQSGKNRRRGVGVANEDTSMNDADSSTRRAQIRNKSNPLARPSTSARPKKVSLNSQPSHKSAKPSGDRSVIDALTRFLNSRYDPNLNFLNLEVSWANYSLMLRF